MCILYTYILVRDLCVFMYHSKNKKKTFIMMYTYIYYIYYIHEVSTYKKLGFYVSFKKVHSLDKVSKCRELGLVGMGDSWKVGVSVVVGHSLFIGDMLRLKECLCVEVVSLWCLIGV